MKNDRQDLFHTTQTPDDFLFSKTDGKTPEDFCEGKTTRISEVLTVHFPDKLSGKAFLDSAVNELSDCEQFAVMALGLDTDREVPNHPNPDNLLSVLEVVEDISKKENGSWGQLDPGLIICFLPGKNSDESRQVALALQQSLSAVSRQTLTIGIASFPTLDYEKHQMVESALKAVDHASFFGPGSMIAFDAVSLNISGDHYYQKGAIDSAIAEYKAALKIDPENINVLNSMGVCYAIIGDFEEAVAYFKKVVERDPAEVMAWYNIALIYKLMGDKPKSLLHFLKADEIKNDVFEIVFQTGKIYFEMGDSEKGKAYYNRALQLSLESEVNPRFIGDCLAQTGFPDKAIKQYEKAIKENPNDAHALSALGVLYDYLGENPEIALVFCRQSIDISPQNSLFRRRLALLYLKQEKVDEALREFKRADALDLKALEKKSTGNNINRRYPEKKARAARKPKKAAKLKSAANC